MPCKRGRFRTFQSSCTFTSGRKYWLNLTKKIRRKNSLDGATPPRAYEMSSRIRCCSQIPSSWCQVAMCNWRQTPLYLNLRKQPFANTSKPTPTPSPFKVETVYEDDDNDNYENSPQMTAPSGEPSTSRLPIHNMQDCFDVPVNLPQFSPNKLLGLTFLYNVGDGERVRAKIVKKILN